MKIVATSNYAQDNFSEYIIAENLNSYYGKLICDLLQSSVRDGESAWPVLKEDDYIPFVWEPWYIIYIIKVDLMYMWEDAIHNMPFVEVDIDAIIEEECKDLEFKWWYELAKERYGKTNTKKKRYGSIYRAMRMKK